MKIRYFAWIRERIGLDEEIIDLPITVQKVSDLLIFLRKRGGKYALALEQPELIRVALDYEHVEHDQKINKANEIALFPPMTGG